MKTSTNLISGLSDDSVSNYLLTADNVNAVPKLTVDWNLNRYYTVTADNTPAEDTNGFDDETFPISSLYQPNRPTKGIAKALVGQATASGGYITPGSTPRFYVGDQQDVYKYWVSPFPTDGSGAFPLHTDSKSTARPRIEYSQAVQANKIVVRFETTWATPNDYNIQIKTTTGGSYSNIAGTSPTIANDGTCTLYYNGTAWVTTRPATLVSTAVAGIQLEVRTMKAGTDRNGNVTTYIKVDRTSSLGSTTTFNTNGANSQLSVIGIEARYEVDMTDRLINENSTLDMASTSDLYPIGTITSNNAQIVLSNDDQLLDVTNTSSPYYNLLKQNAVVNMAYIFTINNVQHSVQMFKMYTGLWTPSEDGTVSVDLVDYAKFFAGDKPRAFMWENKTVAEIVWRICDSVGFVDYDILLSSTYTDHTIPVFWSNGEQTVWELLNSLAEASQTAIYFNSYGRLQVRTREFMFNESSSPNIHLLGQDNGSTLANIQSWGDTTELQSNKITVTYKTAKWKVGTTGKPALSEVWNTDADTLVVRSTPLIQSIVGISTFIYIGQKVAATWPFKSKVQIDGELIQYDGKQYAYYTTATGSTLQTAIVKSQDDINAIDATSTGGHLTGALAITARGVWNSDQRDHLIGISHWTTWQSVNGNPGTTPRGFTFNIKDSTVTIDTPGNMKDSKDLYLAYQGSSAQTGYYMYGTRVSFPKNGGSTQKFGIAFQLNGSNNSGYFVEVQPTNKIGTKERKSTNEVTIWSRNGNTWNKIDKGHPISVRHGHTYDIDVYVNRGTQDQITVWLNGQRAASGTTNGTTKQPDSAKLGMYARGKSTVTFEYFYAIARSITEPLDDFGFWDLKNGGFRGGEWELEHVWHKKTSSSKRPKHNSTKKKTPYTGYLFEEFGPYVHEVREFNVKFDPAPVQTSQLFSTNTWGAAPVEYYADNFGAHFIIANTSRDNAVLAGDDSLSVGSGDSITQVCTVLGRDLTISDETVITKTNDAAIKMDGEQEIELTSDWLQTEEMANDLAVWMSKHWSLGVDQVDVTIFGNPCVEIGDIVDIDWAKKNMAPANFVYFVVGVYNEFNTGLTRLTLRRRNTAPESSLT